MNTAQDIVAYLLASTGGGAQDGEHQAVRQAVINGVREVMQCRHWLWHTRSGSFTTNQIATTATITQNSRDITVASTDGFVPGRIVNIPAEYFATPAKIVRVNPGNVVTLDVWAKRSGTLVPVMPQTYYDLPVDLKDIDTLATNTVGTLHCYISPQEWQRLEINTRGAGEPYYYTIMRSDTEPDRYQVRFVGVPVNRTVVHYTYRVIPSPIKYMGYERICRQGSVSLGPAVPSNVPTVTGTGTLFPQDCAGSYIRFGTAGMEADSAGSNFPYVAERRIEKWLSQTKLQVSGETVYSRPGPSETAEYDSLDGGVVGATGDGGSSQPYIYDSGDVSGLPPTDPLAASNAYNNSLLVLPEKTKYAITDVIDASPQMWTAILSSCELWYARVAGKPGGDAMALFGRDLRIAMENDTVAPMSGRAIGPYPTPRTMGWHSRLLPDIA